MPSRALPRSFRSILPALLAAAIGHGCTPPMTPRPEASTGWIGRTAAPGTSPDGRPPPPVPEPPPAPSPWELASELPRLTPATPRGRSQHFTGEFEAEVRINPAALGYPTLGPTRSLPPGAVLVELHYPPGSTEPVALFAMTKHAPGYDPDAGDWEYLVLTPGGEATHRGRLPLCRRCHAEAPHDHLFGGPR